MGISLRCFLNTGIPQKIRTGLELVAVGKAYERLLKLKGKVQFSRDR